MTAARIERRVDEAAFPTWVPASTAVLAMDLTEAQARALAMLPIESASPR